MQKMGALAKEGKKTYEILMHQCSDLIQDLAMAYGERNTIEECLVFLKGLKNSEN